MTIPVTVQNPGYPGSYGSPFGPVRTVTLAANATLVLPPGNWLVQTGADDTVTFAISATETLTLLGVSSTGLVVSDGQNVQIAANATGGTVTTYIQVLGV